VALDDVLMTRADLVTLDRPQPAVPTAVATTTTGIADATTVSSASRPVHRRPGGRVFGPALMVCSMTSLQFGAALSASLFPRIGAAGASTLRLGFAALIMLAIARPRMRGWSRHHWVSVALLGGSLAGMNGLFYQAIARMPLGAALTVEFLGPLGLAAVLSRRPRDGVWVLAALAGVGLLGFQPTHGHDAVHLAGVLCAAGAGVFWAGYILAGSRLASDGLGFPGLAASTALAALITLPTGLIGAGPRLLHVQVLGMGVLVAVLASVIPYSCEIAALARLPKRAFSVLLALEPAVGAVVGAVLLGQSITRPGAGAIGLVVLAGVGSTLSAERSGGVGAVGELGDFPELAANS
jgi:inner membrane transporter RhtA